MSLKKNRSKNSVRPLDSPHGKTVRTFSKTLHMHKTRMHSSRMRTARSLTVSPSICGGGGAWQGGMVGRGHAWWRGMCGRGACMEGGVHGRGVACMAREGICGKGGGICARGGASVVGKGHAWQRCMHGRGACVAGGHACHTRPPPVDRMTDGCKNITYPQTSFAGGKYTSNVSPLIRIERYSHSIKNSCANNGVLPSADLLYLRGL